MNRVVVLTTSIALAAMASWVAINFLVMGVDQARYRHIAEEAIQSGALATKYHLPFAPNKEIYLHGGNDCLILSMLVSLRESRLKASVSPMMPAGPVSVDDDRQKKLPPDAYCVALAAMLNPVDSHPANLSYYHRYIHGDLTSAGLLLSVLSFRSASNLQLAICYVLLMWLVIASALSCRSALPAERRRGAAFLSIGLSLAVFYALPLFGRLFSFAPTDAIIIGFILFGFYSPLNLMTEFRFTLAAASFGSAIAIFEFLTGGIPIGLAALVALIALGNAPDQKTFVRRLFVGLVAFITAIVICFACKQLFVLAIWGQESLIDFVNMLGDRTGGRVTDHLPSSIKNRLDEIGLSLSLLDSNLLVRVFFAGMMLVYSGFILSGGSHLLGAAIVILPAPLLMLLAYLGTRNRKMQTWPLDLLGLVVAGLSPFGWYLIFSNHTILHSLFMVRPLALSAGLVGAAWIYLPPTTYQPRFAQA